MNVIENKRHRELTMDALSMTMYYAIAQKSFL